MASWRSRDRFTDARGSCAAPVRDPRFVETLPRVFADRQVIHFIDNTWALTGFVKGYASAIDAGIIVNAFHVRNVGLRAGVFFEYVRSAANIADLPSRSSLRPLLRVLQRLGMCEAATRVAGLFPSIASWSAPARDWLARAQQPQDAQVRPDPSEDEESLDGETPRKRQRRSSGHKSGASRCAARNAADGPA